MKRFHFRLDRLLHLRRAEQKQQIAEMSDRVNDRREAENALDLAHRQLGDHQDSYQHLSDQATTAASLANAQLVILTAERSILKCARGVEDAKAKVETARIHLLKKTREVETLARLREKQLAEHEENERRLEQAMFDEIASRRHTLQASLKHS